MDVNILTISGMMAPAIVPQLIIEANFHHMTVAEIWDNQI